MLLHCLAPPYRPPCQIDQPGGVPLTLADWARLQDALIAASFWAVDPDGVDWPTDGDEQRTVAAIIASRGLDGSDWLLQGRRKDNYRAATRWSPGRALYDLSSLFFKLGRRSLGGSRDLLIGPPGGGTRIAMPSPAC